MAKAQSGWGRSGHRRAVVVGAVVVAVVLGGGAAAWAEVGGSSAGYRMADVTRADIATTLTVVGNVEPVSQATTSFQVGGQVASVSVTAGEQVTAGQTLGTLNTTALSEAVSSAQSTVQADEAKLAEDEANQSSAATGANTSSGTPKSTSVPSTTTTTQPSSSGTSSAQSAAITQDQKVLTQDEATLGADQQVEAADLAQAQSDCSNVNTSTTQGQATCEAALQTVSADEQQVSKDQSTVSKDETTLGQALDAAANGGSSGAGPGANPSGGTPPAQTQAAETTHVILTAATATNPGSNGNANASDTGGSGSTNTDTPAQIASDQAAIDTAEAQLTNAQQSLNEATLTSPIAGTVVSVAVNVGDTVSAGSSTETITIVGTNSYEALATLDSSQVFSVKVGQSAQVQVDGLTDTLVATVAQVGPVESNSSGYSYPVTVALPATNETLHPGSAADITISTGKTSDVTAVPTSAVQTLTSARYYVDELTNGQLTRKLIKIGMVGYEYTQVLSGLTPGQSVVLADYSQSVPSSSSSNVGIGGLLGGGGGGFGGGGFFQRTSGAGGKGGVTVQIG